MDSTLTLMIHCVHRHTSRHSTQTCVYVFIQVGITLTFMMQGVHVHACRHSIHTHSQKVKINKIFFKKQIINKSQNTKGALHHNKGVNAQGRYSNCKWVEPSIRTPRPREQRLTNMKEELDTGRFSVPDFIIEVAPR